MTFSYPILWLVLLVVFAGVEGLTAGLISIWFCAGSLVALFASWLDASLGVQIGLFAVVSVLAMALVRPLAKKYFQPNLVKTNADRILDQEGLVLQTIDNRQAQGQIKVGGAVWTARAAQDDQIIPQGALVTVERIEGVKAIVRLAPNDPPGSPRPEEE
jgi:membrane protein implicated in regulation of membrane protease activity